MGVRNYSTERPEKIASRCYNFPNRCGIRADGDSAGVRYCQLGVTKMLTECRKVQVL